jgi:flagellar biosynthetic protein FliQ
LRIKNRPQQSTIRHRHLTGEINIMDSSFALYLGRHTLETALMLAAPILIVCVVVGVVITLFQAVTSIRDMTLTIVPKLLALGAVMLLFSSWMLQVTLRFTLEIFAYIQSMGGG